MKDEKLNNKSSDCNTTFDDTYLLYKYNIGIDYHYIWNRDEERHTKRKQLNNRSSESNTRIKYTYHLYQYNVDIEYHHNRNIY